jgi:exodeoxyribonuclease V alpha subunit
MTELGRLASVGAISDVDARFAEAVARLGGEEPGSRVAVAAALASRAVQRGHVCAHLARLAEEPLVDGDGAVVMPPIDLDATLAALRGSALVSDGSSPAPLVLDGSARLYLKRYYDYEVRLARALDERARLTSTIDDALLERALDRIFGADLEHEQRRAAATAVRRHLAVISGGPGTGKTTTVAALLALIVEQAQAQGRTLGIRLVAPTGKAAQRMGEALRASVDRLPISEEVRRALPTEDASTIHRALGYQPRTPTRFRHDRHNPLSADVVVADEASMIDLALMTKLVEAVPATARLVLLGDKDQLASVDAGAVLADLWDAPSLSSCASRLSKSYRFGDQSRIAALARAITNGDADGVLEVLRGERDMPYGEVALKPPITPGSELPRELLVAVTRGLAGLFEDVGPEERLRRLRTFRVLCAHRRGPAGVEVVNRLVEKHLRESGCIGERALYYDGRPILITANDHQLGLYNGDIGVVCREGGGRRVFFAGSERTRAFPVGRLPDHETVYAMTVHKSQGSEVDRVALILPPEPSPILTRELLYTAVTRAREHVDVFASKGVLRHGIGRRIERASGLADRLADAGVARTPRPT